MSAMNPTVPLTRFARARELVTDLMLATALMWALPLLLGLATAVIRFLLNPM